jgi:NADH dehydrogenase FAD-containing subunit
MSGQHVVIVGGSYAGVTAAKACAAAGLRVTVVEPKDRFDTTFGTVRAMVVDGFEDTLWFPFDRVFPAGSPSRFVRGWATGVDTSSNVLTFAPVAGGAPVALSFDYLILACGTRNSCAWFGKTHSRAE